jgi:beta-N-acetylhexosaminidase
MDSRCIILARNLSQAIIMLHEIGPVILDLVGTEVTQEEREIVQHPSVGGVILFTRNYESPKQLAYLCKSIREARTTPLLIAVDQEGGRVQRFKEGFTRLPSMGTIGQWFDQDPAQALVFAEATAWLMASELLCLGVDMSFAPVLDLNKTANPAIGDRAFHRDPDCIIALAKAWINGMHAAGMAATGKHFPGHGSVTVDSHVGLPLDERSLHDIKQDDLQTFEALLSTHLDAMMPAHIVFSTVDDKPVGFSSYWLQTILRKQYQFAGMIFSDDLNMHGASFAGDYLERAKAALFAGCNMVLICNNRAGAIQIIDSLSREYFVDQVLFKKMQGKCDFSMDEIKKSPKWQAAYRSIMRFIENGQIVI